MKKGTSFILLFAAILGITFSSCKLKVEDENLYDKPGVNVTKKQVTVIIPKMNTDTQYINVYRRDKLNDKSINIGILYHPLALENDQKTYTYIDSLVNTGHSYQYRVRYCIADAYYYSEWSDTIEIKAGYEFEPDTTYFAYRTNGAKIIFEKTDNTLTFDGTVTAPNFTEFASEYVPMIIFQSDSLTQAFEISADDIANHTKIPLIGLLPQAFLDTDITIQGIVGQKAIYDNPNSQDKQIKQIIWTEPAEIDVVGAGSSKKIHVVSQTGSDGFDYSGNVRQVNY